MFDSSYEFLLFVPGSDCIASKEKTQLVLSDCFMTSLLWLIETHIQELEEELKFLKNHSQPNIFVSNKSFLYSLFELLDGEGNQEETLAAISEEAGALATADGNQELKLKCHINYCSSGLL
ncbi:hypothetical protein HID58_018723 [Brassica napus]|uniref:Uncharacterized protein n=1 Tax=Brassica napus TaxID=3708 RepID=A0ABQ8DBW4_BRANA|nr:hypothetical protein HID58_018723 [Brassica napus]